MKIAIVVNVLGSKTEVGQTTYRLALGAVRRGHEVFVLSAGGFSMKPDGRIMGLGVRAVPRSDSNVQRFMRTLAENAERPEWVELDDTDVLLLRNNPSVQTSWAQGAALQFGRQLADRGVLVLNDPTGLVQATNKMYLHRFPESVRPRSLVTRRLGQVERFAKELGRVVIKPVQGSGGKNVFLLKAGASNFEPCFRAVARDGYVMAQEYLEEAVKGDTRVFLMNGVPLSRSGRIAAVRRVPSGDDPRSNVHVGASIRRAVVTEKIERVIAGSRDQLVADGMFFVGLDIIGDRLVEVNVFSPGGLGSVKTLEKIDFIPDVIDALEHKAALRAAGGQMSNAELATHA